MLFTWYGCHHSCWPTTYYYYFHFYLFNNFINLFRHFFYFFIQTPKIQRGYYVLKWPNARLFPPKCLCFAEWIPRSCMPIPDGCCPCLNGIARCALTPRACFLLRTRLYHDCTCVRFHRLSVLSNVSDMDPFSAFLHRSWLL